MKRKLIFPCIMAVIFFAIFIALYLCIILYSVKQHFVLGLIFATPFIIYIFIAISAYKGKKVQLLSLFIIPVLLFYLLFSFFFLAILDTSSTNEKYYSRAVKFSDYAYYPSIKDEIRYFPDEIPENATDIHFEYSSFMDIWLLLEFTTDEDSLSAYEHKASSSCVFAGGFDELSGRYSGNSVLKPQKISSDTTVYILYEHYDDIFEEVCCYYIAIDNESNRIAFCYCNW